jgi:hypothetical protein
MSFPIPLEGPINPSKVHLLSQGEGGTEDCSGSAGDPHAAPGPPGVYTSSEEEGSAVFALTIKPGGFIIFQAQGAEAKGVGSWAVTAPCPNQVNLENELNTLENQLAGAEAQLAQLESELADWEAPGSGHSEAEIDSKKQEIAAKEAEIETREGQVSTKQAELNAAKVC